MSLTSVGALIAMPMDVLSETRASATRVLRLDQADARVGHVDLGARHEGPGLRADLEEALRALEVQQSARSRAAVLTPTSRLARSSVKYDVFTLTAMVCRCSSTLWRKDSAVALGGVGAPPTSCRSRREAGSAVTVAVVVTSCVVTSPAGRGPGAPGFRTPVVVLTIWF